MWASNGEGSALIANVPKARLLANSRFVTSDGFRKAEFGCISFLSFSGMDAD